MAASWGTCRLYCFCSFAAADAHELPLTIIRVDCTMCARKGRYRLARLADKYGANCTLKELLELLAGDANTGAGRSNGFGPEAHGRCRPIAGIVTLEVWAASTRADDDDRLRLLAKPPPRRSGREKKNPERPAATKPAGDTPRRHRHLRSRAALQMPALQRRPTQSDRINLPK